MQEGKYKYEDTRYEEKGREKGEREKKGDIVINVGRQMERSKEKERSR